MNNDLGLFFRRMFCCVLAFFMAGCIALSLSAGISSGLLRSQEFVQKRMEQNNAILLKEVDKAIEQIVAPQTDLPTKAFTQSVREGHIKTVLDQVSGNLVYGFKTDFSQSKYLYGYYRTGIINFCENNGIEITEDEVVRNACLAVDAFNQVCGDESTNFVIPFQEAQSRDPLTAIMVSIVAFALCVVLLEFLNYGGYFKFAYIGMAILTAGFAMIILPAFAIGMDYSSLFDFTDVTAYDLGIAQSIDSVMRVIMWVGAVVLIVGSVFMRVVYNHFKGETIKYQTEIDINRKLREEFLEEQQRFESQQESKTNDDLEAFIQARIAQAIAENEAKREDKDNSSSNHKNDKIADLDVNQTDDSQELMKQEIARKIDSLTKDNNIDDVNE